MLTVASHRQLGPFLGLIFSEWNRGGASPSPSAVRGPLRPLDLSVPGACDQGSIQGEGEPPSRAPVSFPRSDQARKKCPFPWLDGELCVLEFSVQATWVSADEAGEVSWR